MISRSSFKDLILPFDLSSLWFYLGSEGFAEVGLTLSWVGGKISLFRVVEFGSFVGLIFFMASLK